MKELRCWVEIEKAALRHNATVVREKIGQAEILAVVKADGYGHGLVGVAEALADDAAIFGVANLEEALTLRATLAHPIMILGPALPSEREEIIAHGFMPSLSTWEEARAFHDLAKKSIAVNVKIDSGMGRMGVLATEAIELMKRVSALSNIQVHSVSTHLPAANEDDAFTREQLREFSVLVQQLRREVPGRFKAHALQTAGLLGFADEVFDIVRPGMGLYGIATLPEFQSELRPALTWKARIGLLREMPAQHGISYGRTFITQAPMRVATLTCGYADGYPRHLSNQGASVLAGGRRCPLLGRVTMDLMMIDVSAVPNAKVGDEVVLLGRQGEAEVTCAELAERAGTITWEITTRIGKRVPRIYV
ncbi:MAG: alanine racemase [Verrucomicrobiota bacterium]|nr:alanine racemase [Verrucomicrobiota bacterium]